jgi:hypothetical protein
MYVRSGAAIVQTSVAPVKEDRLHRAVQREAPHQARERESADH